MEKAYTPIVILFMCKISIVVPIYNAEKYIYECVESVLKQTYTNLELILVDDGSKDGSFELCAKLAETDPRIKAFTKPNGGVSDARNFGLSKATGDYVAFVDSDDYISEDYCASLMEYVTSGVGMVVLGLQKAYDDGTFAPIQHRFSPGKYAFDDLVTKIVDDGTLSGFTIHSSCAVLFDLNFIKSNHLTFNTDVKYNEDGLFNTEYVLKSGCDVYIDYNKYVYYYRTNLNSATSLVDLLGEKFGRSMTCIEGVLNEYCSKYPCIATQMKRRAATIALSKLIYLVKKGCLDSKTAKNTLNTDLIKEGFRLLDPVAMGKGKRLLCYAVKFRCYWLISKVLNKKFGGV